MSDQPTEAESAIVSAQLGRVPRAEWTVARRCHLGVPMVIENAPFLDDGSPFPTRFWLVCPLLVKRASALEASGGMKPVNELLAADRPLRSRLVDALERYRARDDTIDGDGPSQPGGGPERVKCLHAHLAHELADGPNPVGALTLTRTGWPDCRVPCVRVGATP